MIILVCGSRSWKFPHQARILHSKLKELNPSHIITGGAEGADRLAELWAKANSIPVTIYTANWNRDGRRAGIVRNKLMLDKNPDMVVAFWDGLSRGTKHTITEAEKRKIPVEVVRGRLEAQSDS